MTKNGNFPLFNNVNIKTNKGETEMKRSDKTLQAQEKEIMRLLDAKEETAIRAFYLLRMYYYIDDLLNNRNHTKLINAIYVKRQSSSKWNQANFCNIGHRTAFRYRNTYVLLVRTLFKKEVLRDLAVTLV